MHFASTARLTQRKNKSYIAGQSAKCFLSARLRRNEKYVHCEQETTKAQNKYKNNNGQKSRKRKTFFPSHVFFPFSQSRVRMFRLRYVCPRPMSEGFSQKFLFAAANPTRSVNLDATDLRLPRFLLIKSRWPESNGTHRPDHCSWMYGVSSRTHVYAALQRNKTNKQTNKKQT